MVYRHPQFGVGAIFLVFVVHQSMQHLALLIVVITSRSLIRAGQKGKNPLAETYGNWRCKDDDRYSCGNDPRHGPGVLKSENMQTLA
ncbi:MAG: hypothetical protein M3Q07_27730 [Pseudobdellovibrionaceae bacterium]|nr:hypothetical protein [Pseudobdellovibrionaceae bacterium]